MAKIAFLFPGQGAQSVGMGKALLESLPAARPLFDEARCRKGVIDEDSPCFGRITDGGQAGRAQDRLEPTLEPRVGRGHSGGAGATTTRRFGSVPSLEVTTSWRSAR